jgi:hypothetical protein
MMQSAGDRMPTYRNTQPGLVICLALGLGLVSMLILGSLMTPWLYIPAGILLVCILLFFSLTVEIDEAAIRIWFGPGPIRRSIPLERIASCRVTRTGWYYGWGIRYVFDGWMWNVSGFNSVELTYGDGGHFRIGTDEPEELCAAIEAAIAPDQHG